MKGKIPSSIGKANNFHFNPVHTNDIAQAISFSLDHFVQVQG